MVRNHPLGNAKSLDFNGMVVCDVNKPETVQYCEISANIEVVDSFYLCLLPASYLKNVGNGKENFNLRISMYSCEEELLKNGWQKFDTIEEMNKAAEIENQPVGIRSLIIREEYTIDLDQFEQR